MSYHDVNKEEFNWIAIPSSASVHRAPGCVQCGSKLEMTGQGKYSLSGRCVNCMNRQPDDDALFCGYDEGVED